MGDLLRPTLALATFDMRAPDVVELAVAAEAAGFARLWLGEHLLNPLDHASVHPAVGGDAYKHPRGATIVHAGTRFADPLVALGAAAARTSRIQLATGVYLLALRHPLATAQVAATVQDLAGGRFSLGVGAGWLAEEFEALAVDFDSRGARIEESITILRRAWGGMPFEHAGEHFDVTRVQLRAERIEVPIVVGGNRARALHRAARVGDAWYSSGTPNLAAAVDLRSRLVEISREVSRDRPLPVHIRIPEATGDCVTAYAAEGFDHLVLWADQLWPSTGTPAHRRDAFAAAVERAGLRPWLQPPASSVSISSAPITELA